MKYKSVIVPARGGPEVIEIVEKELRAPGVGEARVKILAAPVTQDDVAVRVGNRPWLADLPFVPGYSILGIVDAVGEGVLLPEFEQVSNQQSVSQPIADR